MAKYIVEIFNEEQKLTAEFFCNAESDEEAAEKAFKAHPEADTVAVGLTNGE